MKVIVLLSAFYRTAVIDQRIGATHVSLYVALLHDYVLNGYQNPVNLKRRAIMTRAKIRSRTTYDQCIHDLHNYGYIDYKPSYEYGASHFSLIELT